MQGLFNQAPIGPKFSDNWVYSGRGLLSQGHRMSRGCEERGCLQGKKGDLWSWGCLNALHYKRGNH